MNVYIAEHNGVYMGGFSVIVADSYDRARELLREQLEKQGLSAAGATLKHLDTGAEHCTVIFNGDY